MYKAGQIVTIGKEKYQLTKSDVIEEREALHACLYCDYSGTFLLDNPCKWCIAHELGPQLKLTGLCTK